MRKKAFLLFIWFMWVFQFCKAQEFFQTASLFGRSSPDKNTGSLNIIQDPRVDTLISRYVLGNKNLKGMWGFRVQIYRNGERGAQEESKNVMQQFLIDFPELKSYLLFQKPGYFLIRAGDFRTKVEGTKQLYLIRRKFPNAYMVQDVINFPDLNKN
jgi:hypothetical protein